MINKKIILLIGGGIIILMLIIILLMPVNKKQETPLSKKDDVIIAIPTKIPDPKDREVLKSIKSRFFNTYKYKDITFDYASNSDTVFVYYSDDMDKAKTQVNLFFTEEGVIHPEKVTIFYVNLNDKHDLPPHTQE